MNGMDRRFFSVRCEGQVVIRRDDALRQEGTMPTQASKEWLDVAHLSIASSIPSPVSLIGISSNPMNARVDGQWPSPGESTVLR